MKKLILLSSYLLFGADAASSEYRVIHARHDWLKLERAQTSSKPIQHDTIYDLRLAERLEMIQERGLTIKRD